MVKRFLLLLLALAMCLGLTAPAYAASGDFVIEDGVLAEYSGPGGSVTIPSGVTTIDWGAFGGCSGLTSITIPDSVTEIVKFAFTGCTGLTDIYYTGTQEQWESIAIVDLNVTNDPLLIATIHYNYEIPTPAAPDAPEDSGVPGKGSGQQNGDAPSSGDAPGDKKEEKNDREDKGGDLDRTDTGGGFPVVPVAAAAAIAVAGGGAAVLLKKKKGRPCTRSAPGNGRWS